MTVWISKEEFEGIREHIIQCYTNEFNVWFPERIVMNDSKCRNTESLYSDVIRFIKTCNFHSRVSYNNRKVIIYKLKKNEI